MTFTDGLQRFETTLVSRMRTAFDRARRAYVLQKRIRQTEKELSALSERELADLGVARCDIPNLARNAASLHQ